MAIALGGAALAIVGLDFWVGQSEAARLDSMSSRPAYEYQAPLGLGFVLPPCRGTILLAARAGSIGPDVAPVVQILADGSLVLRRPASLPNGPALAAGRTAEGFGAAVVLSVTSLDQLTAAARGSLVDLIAQWVEARPVDIGRLRAVDFASSPAELGGLCRWVP
ncbi:MAG: hypothetical protein ABIP94_21625 [Planctomycetota bacterium]